MDCLEVSKVSRRTPFYRQEDKLHHTNAETLRDVLVRRILKHGQVAVVFGIIDLSFAPNKSNRIP